MYVEMICTLKIVKTNERNEEPATYIYTSNIASHFLPPEIYSISACVQCHNIMTQIIHDSGNKALKIPVITKH